jgi:predicted acylesterase/phospholipase RssA
VAVAADILTGQEVIISEGSVIKSARAIKGKILDEKIPSIFKIISQSIMIMENEIVKSRLQKAHVDVIIRPNMAHIGPLDFGCAEECIKESERATEAELGQINKLLERGECNC